MKISAQWLHNSLLECLSVEDKPCLSKIGVWDADA